MKKRDDIDWASLEEQLAVTAEFEERIKLYANYVSLVKAGGRLYTKDATGNENIKVFCLCDTCHKADPQFDEHMSIYQNYLHPELRAVDKHLKSLTDYKERLAYYENYFDRNGTYSFPEAGRTFSILPQNEEERKRYNWGTYQQVQERYFLTTSSIPQYFHQDFNYRRKQFETQITKALYPIELRKKNAQKIKDHYQQQASVMAAEIFASLVDGLPIDDGSETWDWNRAVAIVDAHESFLFLQYLEGQKKSLHQAIQEYLRENEPYPVVSWQMVNDAISEIKEKLYALSNNESRVAYLTFALISFKIKGFEDMFKEAEEYIAKDFDVNHSSEGNIAIITDKTKDMRFHAGLYSIIHGRNFIVIELSEHIIAVYPEIDFTKMMKAVDYKTKTTFWISASEAKTTLTNREQAKLYLYKTELGVEPHLRTAEFKIRYPGKNIELARNAIQANRKPATRAELENILAYLETADDLPAVRDRIIKDLQSPRLD